MISIIPVQGLPEIRPDDDLAALVVERAELQDRDVLVLAQKVVSKAEGRIVRLDGIHASETAVRIAAGERDPREIEVILGEAKRIVRERGPLVITETRHGFICASAGVDHSNASEPGTLILLPLDPDESASRIRERVGELTGRTVGVVITDSFGRPFRQGTTDVAIGISGIPAILDLRGTKDRIGYELRASRTAIADEIAAASDLARGKADGVPAVIVRGLRLEGDGTAQEIVIEPELDLFA
ncbi:MAG: coenzyme F420-0:L-glutamate ligase / coenzyme F420:gamma-L-glutamate ligase [Gaiellaceae bacterium]|jgi:coenzyme F420-0:L-glutamate ligase/coenzyme F420-1:gamma-L-glutamate ligase|nr:coenzyme F420-0:L-glutamate ligase / coenzyme F420:gamma-L-glutamate ligase [Gaiellaceae bacterium]